jgi:prephenate dehydrogenase
MTFLQETLATAVASVNEAAVAAVMAALPADVAGTHPMWWAGYGNSPSWADDALFPAPECANSWNELANAWSPLLREHANAVTEAIRSECGGKISTLHESWTRLGASRRGVALHLLHRFAAERGNWAG